MLVLLGNLYAVLGTFQCFSTLPLFSPFFCAFCVVKGALLGRLVFGLHNISGPRLLTVKKWQGLASSA